MSPPPLISIVLPTYNGSRYLSESVASVKAQSYPHWELLIQDDCSTDGTPALIAQLAEGDPRIQPARNSVNLRLPKSLNEGFARARGDYFTWTSDDNAYHPTALQEMLQEIERHPKVALVYSDMEDMDDHGKPLGPWSAPEPEHLGWVNSVGACFLYRRSVAETVGDYDDRWRLVEDWDYWLRVAQDHEVRVLHRNLYRYRRHEASLTTTRAREIQQLRVELLSARLPGLTRIPARFRAEAYLKLARGAAELGQAERALECERAASELAPIRTAMVMTGRRLLGPERAGALRQWLRTHLGSGGKA